MINIGFTTGVFDMFHIGHLNLLERARSMCDVLIVGVSSDSLVASYKNKVPVIIENDRLNIVKSLKCVDHAFIIEHRDKKRQFNEIKYNTLFVGDDWKGNEVWVELEEYLALHNANVNYLSYTKNISSTKLRSIINSLSEE